MHRENRFKTARKNTYFNKKSKKEVLFLK